MLFGTDNNSNLLLRCLGISEFDVPRFRNCYLKDDRIIIYTRTGGGNRDYYDSLEDCKCYFPERFSKDAPVENHPSGPWNQDLRNIAGYVTDYDDDFDSTYAYFEFSFPEDYALDLTAMSKKNKQHTPSEQWQKLFESMQ